MALTTNPLLSLDTAGSFGQTITFEHWKGRSYARVHATPRNPRSPLQVSTRAMLAFLSAQWAGLSDVNKATWDTLAEANSYSPFNAYQKENLTRWGQFQGPTKAYPATEATDPKALAATQATGYQGYARFGVNVGTNENIWAIVVTRGTTAAYTPSRTTAIWVKPIRSGQIKYYRDGPLASGSYWYTAAALNDDGVVGPFFSKERAIVT